MREALFWNVRDRERIYLCSLVYPETRLVEFVPGYVLNEDPMNLALRAALDYGIESVEEILGLKNPVESVKGVEHAKAFTAGIAVFLKRHGWYRIDPRGDKAGIQTDFCPPGER